MTSTPFTSGMHSTDDHPDVAEISALTEDLLSPERSAVLHRHLSGCALCGDVRASLEEIRGTLGTLPGPLQMPADVAGRIDAALAAEAMLDASPTHTPSVSRETSRRSVEDDRDASPYRGPAASSHAAAAVSRETGTSWSGASSRAGDRPAGHPGGTTRPGRHRPASRPRRWRSALLVGAGAIAALGIGGVVVQSLGSPSSPTASDESGSGKRTAANGALEKRVHSLLSKQESAGKLRGSRTPDFKTKESPANNPLAGGTTSVPSCIRGGIDRTDSPLAVDANVSYKGGSSYLVVFPHRGDSERVDAYVVDSSCVQAESTGSGEVLTTRTYPRR